MKFAPVVRPKEPWVRIKEKIGTIRKRFDLKNVIEIDKGNLFLVVRPLRGGRG